MTPFYDAPSEPQFCRDCPTALANWCIIYPSLFFKTFYTFKTLEFYQSSYLCIDTFLHAVPPSIEYTWLFQTSCFGSCQSAYVLFGPIQPLLWLVWLHSFDLKSSSRKLFCLTRTDLRINSLSGTSLNNQQIIASRPLTEQIPTRT